VQQLIFDDSDDNSVGFVSAGSTAAPASIVGPVQYKASLNPNLTAAQAGTISFVPGSNMSTGQKSEIRYVQVTFSGYVFIDPGLLVPNSNRGLNLIKVNGTYGAPNGSLVAASLASTSYDRVTGNYTVVYGFNGLGSEFGSLEDGNYTLQFNDAAIQGGGPGGPGLAGDPFASQAASFFRFFGDVNGDGKVGNTDLTKIQGALNSRAPTTLTPTSPYVAYLDFSNRGTVTSADYVQFQRRYGYQLNTDGTIAAIDPKLY
jgi:hypothetical protein